MSLTGILGAVLIIAMLMMGVWFGCKGEKEGGGQAQYEENIDAAQEASDAYNEATQQRAKDAEEQMNQ